MIHLRFSVNTMRVRETTLEATRQCSMLTESEQCRCGEAETIQTDSKGILVQSPYCFIRTDRTFPLCEKGRISGF